MRDGAGAEVVLLMDVPVEDGHVLPVLQQIDGLAAVLRGPVPLRGQVEERPVGEHHDGCLGGQRLEIRQEPVELRVADGRLRIGDVVEHGEVKPLVVKRVMCRPEVLLERLALVERGVVLAWHVALHGRLQSRDDSLELAHALVALGLVVGGVGQVAGEDDEIGLLRERVDRIHRLPEGVGRFRVRRAL